MGNPGSRYHCKSMNEYIENQLNQPRFVGTRSGRLIFVLIVTAIAIMVRLSIDFSTPLMPKVNSAYYLVQARSVAEGRGLEYRTPFFLVFWIAGQLANVLHLVRGGDLSDSVILASKLVDSILPVFVCIPIFLLSRKWDEIRQLSLLSFVTPAFFSVIYYPALVMTSDFQKNALGMVWFSLLIYYSYLSIRSPHIRNYLGIIGALLLGSITHVGALGATLAYTMAFAVVCYLAHSLQSKKLWRRFLIAVIVYGLLLLILPYVPLPSKVGMIANVITHPHTLFKNSIIFNILNHRRIPLGPLGLLNIVLIDAIAFGSVWMLLKKRAEIIFAQKITVVAAILTSLILASPLTTWDLGAGRLFLMAYLPASVLLIFLLQHISLKKQAGLNILVLICTVGTALVAWKPITTTAIPEKSLKELDELKQFITDTEKTLIIARHGLEWWAAWTLRTDVTQEYKISEQSWNRYDTVLFLQQIAEHCPLGPMGYGGPPFKEVKIPENAELLHKGRYYLLAKAGDYPDNYPLDMPVMSKPARKSR